MNFTVGIAMNMPQNGQNFDIKAFFIRLKEAIDTANDYDGKGFCALKESEISSSSCRIFKQWALGHTTNKFLFNLSSQLYQDFKLEERLL